MKKICFFLLSSVILVGFTFSSNVDANTTLEATKFKNCTELNKIYKGGVARTKDAKNKGGKTKYTPTVSTEMYDANTRLDRDKDNIACEK
ncbi:excalibur calcium-binding domain-containing protein [Bacillus sp. CGMCC 1.16607]|uniref:excalibur calcium-binding domain-containing protein n=1 Tax=Bacillus sp. CGMCC 1.16607 TaxID=3351842 RepID=UPI0036256E1F